MTSVCLSPTAPPSTPPAAVFNPRAAAELRRWQRDDEAECYRPITGTESEFHKAEQGRQWQKIGEKSERYARHRAAEEATAAYFERLYFAYPEARLARGRGERGAAEEGRPEYLVIAERLRDCRKSGVFGSDSAGSLVVAWDSKCGLVRLCPDEAANESQRLRESYEPGLLALVRQGCRLHKAVFTLPNYPSGRLREGKRYIFKRFRDRIMRARKGKAPRFPVRAALVVQEDPLSARGDWNVHLNVILVTSAFLDYGELRAAWAANLDIRPLPPNYSDSAMAKLWAECVKYAVRTVPEKSAAKAGEGASAAPAFTEWPQALAHEWWQAGKGFRRTRAYGELHALPLEIRQAKALLRTSRVLWLGRLDYRAGKYAISWAARLDSIRADNSTTERAWERWEPPDG